MAERRELSDLRLRLVAPPEALFAPVLRALQRTRSEVRLDWPPPPVLPTEGDAIFCRLEHELTRRIPWSPGEAPLALVVMLDPQTPVDLDALAVCAPDAVLPLPAAGRAVEAVLAVARARFLYERRLRQRIAKLDETLRATRSVERAKAILVAERGLTETEAYSFLRKRAMERRVSVGALASAIVDSHELVR